MAEAMALFKDSGSYHISTSDPLLEGWFKKGGAGTTKFEIKDPADAALMLKRHGDNVYTKKIAAKYDIDTEKDNPADSDGDEDMEPKQVEEDEGGQESDGGNGKHVVRKLRVRGGADALKKVFLQEWAANKDNGGVPARAALRSFADSLKDAPGFCLYGVFNEDLDADD